MKTFEDSKALAEAMVAIGTGHGQEGGRPHHGHGAAPRAGRSGNALEVVECDRDPEGPRAQGPRVALPRARGLDAAPGRAVADPRRRPRQGPRRPRLAAPACESSRRSSSCRAATRGCATTSRSCPGRARRARAGRARRPGQPHRLPGGGPRGHAAGRGPRDGRRARIDPAVGLVLHKKVGDLVIEGEPLVTVHVNDTRRLARPRPCCVTPSASPPRPSPEADDPGRARMSVALTAREARQ